MPINQVNENEGTIPGKELDEIFLSLFNVLRQERISTSDYPVVLYLLSLYWDDVTLKEVYGIYSIDVNFQGLAPDLYGPDGDLEIANNARPFADIFDPIVQKIGSNGLGHIIDIVKTLRLRFPDHFGEIYDRLLYYTFHRLERTGGEYILPKEISQFICGLVELPDDAKVYNPFAGVASFGVFWNSKIEYWAQEINPTIHALGQMRLAAHKNYNAKFELDDSVKYWKGWPINKFDLVVADPPFGRLTDKHQGKFGPVKSYHHFLIERGVESLAENGKLLTLVPGGFLWGTAEKELRRYLVEHDLLEMVISLPSNLLLNTTIPINVILISKRKAHTGVVKFVKADLLAKKSKKRATLFNDVLNEVIRRDQENYFMQVVPNQSVSNNDYHLGVGLYVADKIDRIYEIPGDQELVKLGDVVSVFRGRRAGKLQKGKFVRIRDLKEDRFNYNLDPSSIKDSEIPRHAQEISESCLLLASRWHSLKPTYFHYQGDSIFISSDVVPFRLNEEKLDIGYLINELSLDYISEQVRSLSSGSVIPFLSKEALLSIHIALPGLLEQKAKVKGAKEAYLEGRERELQLERQFLGVKDAASKEFESIRHTFRQWLNNAKSNLSGTRKFLLKNKNKSVTLDSIYSVNLNRTLGEHLLSLEGTIDSMLRLLLDEEHKSGIVKDYNLEKLIKQAQDRSKDPDVFEFERLFVDRESFELDGEFIEPIVEVDEDNFFRLFSNIVSNAIAHGFENSTKKNIIRSSIYYNGESEMIVMEVSNNGRPFPDTFTEEHLKTRGERTSDSKGQGIGGPDINAIANKYKGIFHLRNVSEADFPVTYIISFPLKK